MERKMDSIIVGTALLGGLGIAFAMQHAALCLFLRAMVAATNGDWPTQRETAVTR